MTPTIPLPGRDYELKLPKGYLSFSQMDLFETCGVKYERRYLLKEQDETSPAQQEGTWHAKVLEESFLQQLNEGHHYPRLDALSRFKQLVDAEGAALTWGREKPADVIKRARHFYRKCWSVIEALRAAVKDGLPLVEYRQVIEIAGVPVEMVTDVVLDSPRARVSKEVVDWKVTGSKKDAAHSLQLSLGAYAFGVRNVAFGEFNKRDLEFNWRPAQRNMKNLKGWLEVKVSRIARAISLGVFVAADPDKTKLCDPRWCGNWSQCYGNFR